MKTATFVAVAVILLVAIALAGALYVVDETQQVVITQFGEPIGAPVTSPGLHVKTPIIQKPNYFDKRFLEWDGERNQIPTRDKRFIFVDSYARWQIVDPLKFFQRLRDERGAQSRLDDILDGETRDAIAQHDLIEVVRTSNRGFAVVDEVDEEMSRSVPEIEVGREKIAQQVLAASNERTRDLGIAILDFRFKRINYVPEVRKEVYNRMISERNRIAEQYRSEGEGEAARIQGEKEKLLKQITSEAYRQAQEIRGKADARATAVYAAAHGQDPDFYRFLKSMETYRQTIGPDTTLVLSTDGEFLRFLKSSR